MGRRATENTSLNALRVAAAILVTVSHAKKFLFFDSPSPHTLVNRALYTVLDLGHPAVIVFFVLSGYWVGGSVIRAAQQRRFSWLSYGVNRLSRLWLVLIPAVLVTAAADGIGLHYFTHTSLIQGWSGYYSLPRDLRAVFTLPVALGNLVFLQGIRTPTFGTNGPLWSLADEFWFYTLFPLLLLAARFDVPISRRMAFAAIAAGTVILVGETVVLYFTLWLLGALVAHKRHAIDRLVSRLSSGRELALRLGLIGVVAATMLMDAKHPGFGSDVLVALGSASLIMILLIDRPWGRLNVPVRLFSRYAHSSYSLYAIHFPLLVLIAAAIAPDHARRWLPTTPHLLALAGIVAGVMVVSWVFARFTEHHTDAVRAMVISRLRTASAPVVLSSADESGDAAHPRLDT
jgi:peptidoglycan/LPS O-acetylase OafA/YrhL